MANQKINKNKVETCYLLSDKSRTLKTQIVDDGIQVQLVGDAPDKVASVIVLKLKEMPNALPIKGLGQNEQGEVILPAFRAQYENLQGPGALYNEALDCISSWKSETARVYWSFKINKPGMFKVISKYSGKEATQIIVSLNGESKKVTIPASGNNRKRFKDTELGVFNIDKAGKYEISFMPLVKAWKEINLKEVRLIQTK